MNIVRLLKDNGVTSQIRFYGINDMATGFEVKNLLENKEIIDNYLKKIKCKITNLDEYIDYLYLRCMVHYDEIIPNVREDIREKFSNQITEMKEIFSKYQEKDLAMFVKNNYEEILNEEYKGLYLKQDVIDYTIEFLLKYCSKDNEIIKYIITNFSYKVYDNFDSFKKFFNKSENLEYYDLLMTEELLSKDMNYRLSEIKKALETLKIQNIDKYNEKVNKLVKLVKKECFDTNEEKVMTTYTKVENVKKVLADLQHKSYYEFEKELKKQAEILNEHLKKKGHSTKFEISIKPLVDIYEDDSKEWYQKSLMITHSPDKKAHLKLITNLEYTIKYFERSQILDHVSTNCPSDQEFTYSVINNLSISMMQGKYAINYMVHDNNRLNDLLSYIFAGVNTYFGDDSLYYSSERFEFDLNMLFNAIIDFKKASSDYDDIKTKWLVYSIQSLLCGIIEKTLRNVFYDKTKENKYVNSKNATLGSLVSSEEVIEVIGKNNCSCIEYYLLDRNGVGKNTRNDFSHYNDSLYDKLIYDTILESLYLLLTISNILLLASENYKTKI